MVARIPPRKVAPVSAKKYVILPDAHFPHQDPQAMACVLAAVRAIEPDEIIVLGDWLDAGGFSSYPGMTFDDGAHSYLQHEVAPCNAFLDLLQGPNHTKLVYLEGNHEYRVFKHIMNAGGKVARDLNMLASPERCLRYRIGADGTPGEKRKRYTYVPYVSGGGVHAHYKIAPDLIGIHGWSFAVDFNSVNERAAPGVSIVCGHVHRHAVRTVRDSISGVVRRYWSPGCLAKLAPLYMANSPHNWTHGFTVLYQSRTHKRDWTAQDVSIRNGRAVLPCGKLVSA